MEANRLLKRYNLSKPKNKFVLFETGYGPSGLPHIGTFGEVVRTTMVRKAFEQISGLPTKLIAFSDDMDGLRKVPDNIPKQEIISKHLGKPLTQIPGFDYEFKSASEMYKSGAFDEALMNV